LENQKLPEIYGRLNKTNIKSLANKLDAKAAEDKRGAGDLRQRFHEGNKIYSKETGVYRKGRDSAGMAYTPSTDNLIGKKLGSHSRLMNSPDAVMGTAKRTNITDEVIKKSAGLAGVGSYSPIKDVERWDKVRGGGSFGKDERQFKFPNARKKSVK